MIDTLLLSAPQTPARLLPDLGALRRHDPRTRLHTKGPDHVSTPIRDRFAREYGITGEYDLEQLQAVLDEHAHQLAEQQRTEADALHQTTPGVVKGLRLAADLIDPEAK